MALFNPFSELGNKRTLRVMEIRESDKGKRYYIQQRVLWLLWVYVTYSVGYEAYAKLCFKTYEEARDYVLKYNRSIRRAPKVISKTPFYPPEY